MKRHGSQLVLLWQSNFNVAFILLTSEILKRSGEIDFWRGLFEGPSAETPTPPARAAEVRDSGEEGESRRPGFVGQERGQSLPSDSALSRPPQRAILQP